MKKHSTQQGLGLVEIIVAVAVILVAFTSVLLLFQLQVRVEEARREDTRAYAFLSEAMEGVRSVRDDAWANLSGLTVNTNYYPQVSGSAWVLSTNNPGPTDGYTRWVVFRSVRRDIATNDGIVSSGGYLDPDTLQVTAYVEWQSRGKTKQKSVVTYMTNWQNKI